MCNAILMQLDGQLVLRILSEITLVGSFYDLSVSIDYRRNEYSADVSTKIHWQCKKSFFI